MPLNNKLSAKEIKIILKAKDNALNLSKKLGRNIETIRRIARGANIKLPKLKTKRKYSVNDYFFHKWSKSMAYVLGFIAADGCVYIQQNQKVLSFGLAIKDKQHLIKIKKLLAAENPVSNYKTNCNNKIFLACSLRISSEKIVDKLVEFGITPRKSLTLKFPNIPDKYLSHFIRGYSDGDGSITKVTPKKYSSKMLQWRIIGTYDFLRLFQDKIFNIFKFKLGSLMKNKKRNYYTLCIGGNEYPLFFLDWMYKNSKHLRLTRKYVIYKSFKKYSIKNARKFPTGVTKHGKKFQCSLKYNKKNYYLGTFNTIKEAAIAYNNFIKINNIQRKLNLSRF